MQFCKKWQLSGILSATIALFGASGLQAQASQETLSSEPPKIAVEQQIEWLDLEILLLKAELAQKSGDYSQVRGYLNELQKQPLPSHLKPRFDALMAYVDRYTGIQSTVEIPFKFVDNNIVVLLPLSGPFQTAGEKVLSGLRATLTTQEFHVIDTAIYDNPFELWELVKLYQPSFIFGPLRQEFAQAFAQIETKTPTLILNQVSSPYSYVKNLSPNRTAQLPYLVNVIQKSGYQKILLLVEPQGQAQLQVFMDAWHKILPESRFEIVKTVVNKSIDEALSVELGASTSEGRRAWLQKTIGMKLEDSVRVRQDIDLVVSLLSLRGALQVSPLLKFYHLNQVLHVWIPTHLPIQDVFISNLAYWQSTQVLLPVYYANEIRQKRNNEMTASPEDQAKPSDVHENEEFGIFYALGNVAAEVVNKMGNHPVFQMDTRLGKVRWDEQKDIELLPSFYWLDKGSMTEQINQTN